MPHLMNINSDPMMTGSFKKAVKSNTKLSIGKTNTDVQISGVGIAGVHCEIEFNEAERKSMIIPNEEHEKFVIKVNGEIVTEPKELQHGDRLLVGMHHYYLFRDPAVDDMLTYNWEDAMKEANKDALN